MIKEFLLASLVCLPAISHGQLIFSLTSRKSGDQTSSKTVSYTGGNLRIDISDGSWQIAGCADNGITLPEGGPVFPYNPGCPLGTTGFVALGDIDFDGVRDDGSFWSLPQAPITSRFTEPFRPDLVKVVSSPPSKFPRPGILPVAEGGAVLWYNVLTGADQRIYEIAGYVHEQDFRATKSGRELHDETVVTGTYKFGLPALLALDQRNAGIPPGQLVLDLTKRVMPESYPGLTQSHIKAGFRFSNDDNWHNGALEFDPRLFINLKWVGIDQTNSFYDADTVRFWMQRVRSVNPFEMPRSPSDFNVSFPPSGSPFILRDKWAGGFLIGSNFYRVGDRATIYLRLDRNHYSTAVTRDTSVRVWTADVNFIDTFEGFALGGFPPGTPEKERAPDYDFDGDGASNILEYALSTDPNNPASNPTSEGRVVPFINGDGQCEVSITKRADVGGSLRYDIEYSSDMLEWTRIEAGDPEWQIVTDNDFVITAQSLATSPPASCYVRAAITILN